MRKNKKKRSFVRCAAYPARGNMDVTAAMIRCALACSAFIVLAGALSVSGLYARMPQWASMLLQAALTIICFCLPAVHGLFYADGDQSGKLALQALSAPQIKWLTFLGVLLVCPMTLLSDLLYAPFIRLGLTGSQAQAIPAFALFLPMLVKSVILAPVSEELFFRGYLFAALKEAGGRYVLFITALFFALVHGVDAVFIPRFLLGLLLGWMMLRTDSILAAIILHATYNLTVLLLSFCGLGGLFSGLTFVSCLIRVPLCALFFIALKKAYTARCANRRLRWGRRMTRREWLLALLAVTALIACPLIVGGA